MARWVADRVRDDHGFTVDILDIAAYPPPLSLPALPPKIAGDSYPRPDSIRSATALLEAADAFVIVTPEYNHSYPASLKALIDWHFTQWTAKPVAFVSYGGAAGGRHAVLHLENVLTELNAVTIATGLLFPNYFATWRDEAPSDPGAAAAAAAMLTELRWWGRVLRNGRNSAPYPTTD